MNISIIANIVSKHEPTTKKNRMEALSIIAREPTPVESAAGFASYILLTFSCYALVEHICSHISP